MHNHMHAWNKKTSPGESAGCIRALCDPPDEPASVHLDYDSKFQQADSMPEMAAAGQHHGHAGGIGGLDDFLVAL